MIDAGSIVDRLRARSGRVGLLPVVTLALCAVLILKVAHLSLGGEGGSMAITTATAQEKAPDAAETPKPDAAEAKPADAEAEAETETEAKKPAPVAVDDRPKVGADDAGEAPRFMTKSEVEVLNRLTQRRKEIEQRERDLEMREALMKATEKRVEAKLAELKQIEMRIEATFSRQDKEKTNSSKVLSVCMRT